VGKRHISEVSHNAPTARERDPSVPQFGVPFYFMRAPFDAELRTKFDVITHIGRGLVLGVNNAPLHGAELQCCPISGGSLIFMRTPVDAELPTLT